MNNLRELRKENGFNQEQMAAELGVSLSMYQKVEQGNAKAGRKFMEKIDTCSVAYYCGLFHCEYSGDSSCFPFSCAVF